MSYTVGQPPTPLGVFGQLPLELRQQIWTCLLPQSANHEDFSDEDREAIKTSGALHLNWAIYLEASRVLYRSSSATFTLRMGEDTYTLDLTIQHPVLGSFNLIDGEYGRVLREYKYRVDQNLRDIPWSRFKSIQINLHPPSSLMHAMWMRSQLRLITDMLAESAAEAPGFWDSACPVLVQFQPDVSTGKPWKRQYPRPKVADEHVADALGTHHVQPGTIAFAALAPLICEPRFEVNVQCGGKSRQAIYTNIRKLSRDGLLDHARAGPTSWRLGPRAKGYDVELLDRDMQATHDHLLDYMCGRPAFGQRGMRQAWWDNLEVKAAVESIRGHEREAEFRRALLRRHMFHMHQYEYWPLAAVGSEEWKRYFGDNWPDEKIAEKVWIEGNTLRLDAEFEKDLLFHDYNPRRMIFDGR